MNRTAVINVYKSGNPMPIRSVHCDMSDLHKEMNKLRKEYPEPEYGLIRLIRHA